MTLMKSKKRARTGGPAGGMGARLLDLLEFPVTDVASDVGVVARDLVRWSQIFWNQDARRLMRMARYGEANCPRKGVFWNQIQAGSWSFGALSLDRDAKTVGTAGFRRPGPAVVH